MYVLIVSRGYPSEKYRMNGIFEFDQAKALVAIGIKVVFAVIDLRSIKRKRKFGLESFVKDGVYVEIINIPCGDVPKYILYSIGMGGLKLIYSIIKKKYGVPQIIHAHFTHIGYIVTRTFKKSNIPIIVTEHSSLIHNKEIENKLCKVAEYTYKNADKIIAVSTSLSNSINQKFNIDADVVPNIVNTNIFTYKDIKKDKLFHITSTGNLIKNKRMDLLVDAFNIAFSGNPNIHLSIFGDGVEKATLEQQISKYKLENNIHLMGLQPRFKIAEHLQNSECFILASKSETFGVAYIEALAAGVPVIATRCGGPEDFINEKNGILVDVDDIDSLSKALIEVHMNIKKYNKKNISDDTKKYFSESVVSQKLIDIYTQILNERKQ